MKTRLIQPEYTLSNTDKVGISNEEVIAYTIDYVKDQPKGVAVLYFKTLDSLKTGRDEEIELLRALSHMPRFNVFNHPATLVARIEEFYPYGRDLTEEELKKYSGNGVASILLKLMEIDAQEQKARVLYGIGTTEQSIDFFGGKKAFNDVGFKLPYLFYKLL